MGLTSFVAGFRRRVYAASVVGLLAVALCGAAGGAAVAQQAGSSWRGLIPALKA